MESKNARLGLQLFSVYLLLYGGFVFISAFSPTTMEKTPVAGINLAILYGFGLIVAALVLALIYGVMCKGEDESPTPPATPGQSATSAESSNNVTHPSTGEDA